MIDTVLFDLDGTLLPMDQDQFLELYMKALAKTFAPGGYDPKLLVSSVCSHGFFLFTKAIYSAARTAPA